MVITQLFGGLGNQMFQYAIAKSLSIYKNVPVKIDHINLALIRQEYALDIFDADFTLLKNGELHQLQILIEKNKLLLVQEAKNKEFQYDTTIFDLPYNSIYLAGYWQNEKYFSNIVDTIKKDFSFKKNTNKNHQLLLEEIESCNSVAVHIRRGDYAQNATINKIFGLCSLEYYRKTAEFIAAKVPKAKFFVFVFDQNFEWIKNYFYFPYQFTIVDINESKNYKYDLQLMSACKHQIIANSTFGWWAAWLNPNRQKIICAPQKWMQTDDKNTSDLIPENWYRF